jgi:hypothetical protein
MHENEEVKWDEENLPHNPLANAIFEELHFHRYDEYLGYAEELKKNQFIRRLINGINITFKINKCKVHISYLLPDGNIIEDIQPIDWKPLVFDNRVEEQLLLAIAEAETNALLFKKDNEFKLYNFPAVGFYQPVKNQNALKYKIYSLRARLKFFLKLR